MDIEHKFKKTFSIQQMSNSRTRIFCIFIGAGDSVILLEIAVAEDNPKTGHRWYDRFKEFIEYICKNWMFFVFVGKLLVFVWGKFHGM